MANKLFGNFEPSFEDNRWNIKNKRSNKAEQLIDYIVLAEFDIDTGSTVRYQYPNDIPGYKPDWFAEHMLPEGAHNREQDWTYMLLNRNEKQLDEFFWISPNQESIQTVDDPSKRLLYGINLVFNKADSSVRRGAIVKSIAIFSRYHFVEIFREPLLITLEKYYTQPGESTLRELYEALNFVQLDICPRPNIIEQSLMHWGISHTNISSTYNPRSISFQSQSQSQSQSSSNYSLIDYTPSKWYYTESIALFDNLSLPIHIPLHTTPDDLGISNLTFLIKIFRESTMKIYHAILTKKRILFVGYDHAAGDVCQMVLSTISMVAPPFVNIIKRAFPYANLSDLSFLEVDGFIAGVTNPMFQQHDSWYDLLCILDLPNKKGTVQTAEERRAEDALQKGKQYTPPPPSSKATEESMHEGADLKFIQSVISGIDAKLGEEWVRLQFYEYTQTILSDAQDIYRRSLTLTMNSPPSSLLTNTTTNNTNNTNNTGITISTDLPLSNVSSTPPSPSPIMLLNEYSSSSTLITSSTTITTTTTTTPSRNTIAPLVRGTSGLTSSMPFFIQNNLGQNISLPSTLNEKVKKRIEVNRYRIKSILSSLEFSLLPTSPWVWSEYETKQSDQEINVTGELLFSQIRRLQTESNLDEMEIEAIYLLLVRGLNTESSLQALLSLLPLSSGGLQIIGVGLFHTNIRIRCYTIKLLQLLSNYKSTKGIADSINQYYKFAIQRNLALLNEQNNISLNGSMNSSNANGNNQYMNGNGNSNSRNGSITR